MKNSWKFVLLGIALLLGYDMVLYAAAQVCQPTDFWCYESGPSQNLSTMGRMDSSGNLTVKGTSTVQGTELQTGSGVNVYTASMRFIGPTIFSPTSATGGVGGGGGGLAVTTQTIPTATYMTLISSGSNLLMSGLPSIATATVVGGATALPDGQLLILGSTATISYTFQDNAVLSGTRIQLKGSLRTAVVSSTGTLTLMYSAPATMWIQQ